MLLLGLLLGLEVVVNFSWRLGSVDVVDVRELHPLFNVQTTWFAICKVTSG